MSFTDHKITQFTHRIVDLPDQPNLPADELKARFDSSPEELRQAVNGICDDADRLDNRVSGIIAETFGDAIPKSMLSDELQDEIDAKATQTALAAVSDDVTAEAAARTDADDALADRIDEVETSLSDKVEIHVGTFTGNGSNLQNITMPFKPDAALIITDRSGYGAVLTKPLLDLYDPDGNRLPYVSNDLIQLRGVFNASSRKGCYLLFRRK